MNTKKDNPFVSAKNSMPIVLQGLIFSFKILSKIAPTLAGRLALRAFLTPPRHPLPVWQGEYLKTATQSTVKIKKYTIKKYKWGHGPTVLLVHGWGGRGTQLGAFVSPLVKAGYGVITFDGPAHGDSSGKQGDMFDFASVIHVIAQSENVKNIIAHSFGAACTLLAIKMYYLKLSKLILIGCPSDAIWITEVFAEKLCISKKIIKKMRENLERRYKNTWTWEELSLIKLIKEASIPALLIHDKNDQEVPFEHALQLKNAMPSCELLATEGQGHRRILRSSQAISKSLEYFHDRSV